MCIKGEIVFSISDSTRSLESIEELIGLNCSRKVKKGEQITGLKKAPFNIWMYYLCFDNFDSFRDRTNFFASQLFERLKQIEKLKNQYEDISIDFYIRSEKGQMGYTIPKEALKKITDLDIDLNFHILSFGEI